MDLSGLDRQPARVVEAKIIRYFNAPINFDPSLSPKEFFLVFSVGHANFV